MSLQGDLKTLPAEDLAQTLAQGGSTGTLIVRQGDLERKFFFDQGRIAGSASSDPREHLGTFLITEGLVDQATLDHAMRLSRETGIHLGQVLVTLGVLGVAELNRVIRLKVERAFGHLVSNPEGRFEFRENERPQSPMVPTSLNVAGVVLAGGLRADEKGFVGRPSPAAARSVGAIGIPSPEPRPVEVVASPTGLAPRSNGAGDAAAKPPRAMAVRTPPGASRAPVPATIEARTVTRRRDRGAPIRLALLDRRSAPLALAVLLLALVVAMAAYLPQRTDRPGAGAGESPGVATSLASLPVGTMLAAPGARTEVEIPAVDAQVIETSPEAGIGETLEGDAVPAPEPEVFERLRGLVDSRAAEIERSVEQRYEAEIETLRQQLENVRREMKEERRTQEDVARAVRGDAGAASESPVVEVQAAATGATALGSNPGPAARDAAPASVERIGSDEGSGGESPDKAPANPVGTQDPDRARTRGGSRLAVGSSGEAALTPPVPSAEPPVVPSANPLVVRPKILENPQPSYPRAAKLMRREGEVVLRVLVGTNGEVLEIEQLSKPLGGGFDETARNAALQSRWLPGSVNGDAEPMWAELRFDFRLSD